MAKCEECKINEATNITDDGKQWCEECLEKEFEKEFEKEAETTKKNEKKYDYER